MDRLGSDWDATVTGGDIDRTGGKKKKKHQGQGASQSPTRVCNGVVSVCECVCVRAWRDCIAYAPAVYRVDRAFFPQTCLDLYAASLASSYRFHIVFTP